MIHDASTLVLPLSLRADLCVIGSGPGGATAAMIAAEAGLKVVLLEVGELITPGDTDQREESMLPRLFHDGGGRTTADRSIRVHQGKGVGGSSLHNTNLCKRIPPAILARWRRERGLSRLDDATLDRRYDQIEALLGVTEIAPEAQNRHNRLLAEGAAALGWAHGPLRHNREGCVGSGFCELGCAFDGKNNALKRVIPRVVRAGAQVITRAAAIRVVHDGRSVRGVDAVALGGSTPGAIHVDTPRVCVAASATATAALLLASKVPHPPGAIGDRLHLHPAVVVAGDFDEPVRAHEGIPQSVECTEHLQLERDDPAAHRVWILPAFAHPMGTATMVSGLGAVHRSLMLRYGHLAVLTAMLHDHSSGTVRPAGDRGVVLDYTLTPEDRRELAFGLSACSRLLFAAGARRVLVAGAPPVVLERGASDRAIDALAQLDPVAIGHPISAVHPMGTVPMGDDPATAAVDAAGRSHQLRGLWVADGSLLPGSIGVPPQLSIYAFGLHAGAAIAADTEVG